MSLDNNAIDERVRRVVGMLLKDVHPKPHEEACIQAGVELLVNLLQNVNDIAYEAVSRDHG